MEFKFVKFEVFIPDENVDKLISALNKIDALKIGNYESCFAKSKVKGHWKPLEGSKPHIGQVEKLSSEDEAKIEFTCKRDMALKVKHIIKEVHPYEVPVINIIPLIEMD